MCVCVIAGMGFARKQYEFLSEIGLSTSNLGCFVNGTWKGSGPVVSTVNPANNQVLILCLWMCFSCYMILLLIVVTVIMIDGTVPLLKNKIMNLTVFFFLWSTFELHKALNPKLRPCVPGASKEWQYASFFNFFDNKSVSLCHSLLASK